MSLKTIFTTKTSDICTTPYIPERFQREVSLHIFKNYYANKDRSFKTPLILAISGAPGMGKTFQAEAVLSALGVKKFVISGAEFENENAGIPVKNLRNMYKNISDDVFCKMIKMGAIIIDDIDAALGQWGGLVQYTMNRQHLIKTLIDFADNPYLISAYDDDDTLQEHSTGRIPIIVTLNDETKMYEPLMRNGRTTIFPWIPTPEEISHILNSIFNGIVIDKSPYYLYEELLTFMQNTSNEEASSLPISLFSDIRASLNDEYIWQQICADESFDTISNNLSQKLNSIQSYRCSDLVELGKLLLHKNKNYLSSDKQ